MGMKMKGSDWFTLCIWLPIFCLFVIAALAKGLPDINSVHITADFNGYYLTDWDIPKCVIVLRTGKTYIKVLAFNKQAEKFKNLFDGTKVTIEGKLIYWLDPQFNEYINIVKAEKVIIQRREK